MISLKDYIINESKENYVNSFVILKPEFLEHEEAWLKMLEDDEDVIVYSTQENDPEE